jgi:hypothetical protein
MRGKILRQRLENKTKGRKVTPAPEKFKVTGT